MVWIGTSEPVLIHTYREDLTHFSNIKSIIFHTLELVHQVGKFKVSMDGNEIAQLGIRSFKRLSEKADATCFCTRFGCIGGIFLG